MSDERIFRAAGAFFFFWNFVVVVAAIYCIVASGKSPCASETAFGKMVTAQNYAGVAIGFLVFLGSGFMF